MEILNKIQQGLKAPKGQRNTFGNYNYRSCEDILEAVKPLLGEAILTITDEVVCMGAPLPGTEKHHMKNGDVSYVEVSVDVGTRFYIKATVTITHGEESVSVSAFARESAKKKGMDEAQITGATSSYARKYALNGLFCIDDTKDADSTNTHGKDKEKKVVEPQESIFAPYVKATGLDEDVVKARLKKIGIDSPAKLKKANVEDTTIILKECK